MAKNTKSVAASKPGAGSRDEAVFDAFRRWGYLEANLDPLGFMRPLDHPELRLKGAAADERARDLLRHDRRGIRAHSGPGAPPLDDRADGSAKRRSPIARTFSNG